MRVIAIVVAVILLPAATQAQRFVSYQCTDGSQFTVAFYESSVGIQVDGKALLLPKRVSVPGTARYRKSTVSLTIKGDNVTLRRGTYRVACTGEAWLPSRLLREPEPD